MNGYEVLGAITVGVTPVTQEAVYRPYRVVVTLRGDPQSHAFGSELRPVPPATSPIERVVVRGGTSEPAFYDRRDTIYRDPSRVEVYLHGVGFPHLFEGDIKQALVAGGLRSTTAATALRRSARTMRSRIARRT